MTQKHFIARDGLLQSRELLQAVDGYSQIAVITDDCVAGLYLDKLVSQLKTVNSVVYPLIVPAGEASKSRETKYWLEDQLLSKNFDRYSLIVALGGGMITDLAGYVAATLLRGVDVIYLPTTLMAMADAAIGGKTGVNTPYGKNLIGAFKRPKATLVDVDTLATLPLDDYRNAFAEMVKHALVADYDYFQWLELNSEPLKNRDTAILACAIERSYELKTGIIEADFHEAGQRMLLNLGHTVAHAIEKASHFELPHGKAVAIGILAEALVADYRGLIEQHHIDRIQKLFNCLGVDLSVNIDLEDSTWQRALAVDKKNRSGLVRCVLLQSIGEPCIDRQQFAWPVSPAELGSGLRQILAARYIND